MKYRKHEINAVVNQLALAHERDTLTDDQKMKLVNTFTGQMIIFKLRVKRLKQDFKEEFRK